MPTVSGQYYAQDYVAELKAAGFDGFSDADLLTYVNRGYFHVARRSQWMWEQTTDVVPIAAGTPYVDLWPTTSGELPYFRSLDKLMVTTAGKEKQLKLLSDEEFFSYLSKDLTSTSNRGEPSGYYIYQNRLYVLPPASADRTVLAYYHRRAAPLVNGTDLPLTPQHLDEAILLAAKIRCHKRANEPTLAAISESDLEEFFDDMRDDEEEIMQEKQDRVRPDNSWL